MLEHQKMVLNGVAFDKYLFRKELNKSIKWLSTFELEQLKKWVVARFGDQHPSAIEAAFGHLAA